MTIDIIDDVQSPQSAILIPLCRKLLQHAVVSEAGRDDFELSLTLTDNARMRILNREQRNIDKSTDVLSFPLLEFGQDEIFEYTDPDTDEIPLGDIVISLEQALLQAEDYGHSIEREMGYLCVHAALHLLGYDHMTEEDKRVMREREEALLNSYDLTR